MAKLRVGVVGVGHLGKEHARILAGLPDVELVGVADVNLDQARAVAGRCGTPAFSDYRALLGGLDAAVIAVPTTHHHAVASHCLRQGVALLVEKPLAVSTAEADELVDLAAHHGVVLQVGHVERFNPAFEELQRYRLQPRVVSGQRVGPFTGRSTDVGAVLDLMIHDLDLLLALVREPVEQVDATGLTLMGGHEDVATAHLVFAGGCVADLTASRVHSSAARRLHVWGDEGGATLDCGKRTLTLVQPAEPGWGPARAGSYLDVLELERPEGDQLTKELIDFVHCVRTGSRPRVNGEDGRDAVALAGRILECITRQAGQRGVSRGPLFTRTPSQAA
jgi:predicted dehydrogenase